MSRLSRSLLLFFVLAAALAVSAGIARATVVVPVSLADQVSRSEVVVRATVIAQRSDYSPDRSTIYTWTTLRVTDRVKGNVGMTIELRQMGGVVGDVHMAVPGDGHLSVGEDVVLLLHQHDGNVFLFSLAQSVYHVDAHGLASRDLSELSFATWENGRMSVKEAPRETPIAVATLLRQLRTMAGGAR